MKKIIIPKTNLAVSSICFGGTAFMDHVDSSDAFLAMDYFENEGGNFFDTANVYGKWLKHGKNSNELLLGKWFASRKNRNRIIVGTKCAHPPLSDIHFSRLNEKEILMDVEESLTAMGTDYTDILWLHRDDEKIPVAEVAGIMERIVKSGKARYFGCSNWKTGRILEMLNHCNSSGVNTFIANQARFSLATVNPKSIKDDTTVTIDDEGVSFHKKYKFPLLAYSSQSGGFFTKLAENRVSLSLSEAFDNQHNREIFNRLTELTKQKKKTLTSLSLAYLTSQDFVCIPIIGARTIEQLKDCLLMSDYDLSGEELKFLKP